MLDRYIAIWKKQKDKTKWLHEWIDKLWVKVLSQCQWSVCFSFICLRGSDCAQLTLIIWREKRDTLNCNNLTLFHIQLCSLTCSGIFFSVISDLNNPAVNRTVLVDSVSLVGAECLGHTYLCLCVNGKEVPGCGWLSVGVFAGIWLNACSLLFTLFTLGCNFRSGLDLLPLSIVWQQLITILATWS